MSDADDAIANLAVGLNEDAKAKRRGKKGDAVEAPVAGGLTGTGEEGPGWEPEREHTTAVDRMELIADELELETTGLISGVRDFLLDTIKARPKPWSATSQAEQRDVAAACEHAGRELVRKIVEAVASAKAEPVRVLLTKVTIGDDMVISGKVKTFSPEEEDRAVKLLHHARGKHVMLTAASVEDYDQNRTEAETDEDQPGLGFEAGGEDDDYGAQG